MAEPDSYWTVGEYTRVAPGPGYFGATPVENQAPPSTYAVAAVLEGQPGSVVRLIGVTMIRAVFIIPGVWVGARLTKVDAGWLKLLAMSGLASVTISMGMLAWYGLRRLGAAPQPPVLDGAKR